MATSNHHPALQGLVLEERGTLHDKYSVVLRAALGLHLLSRLTFNGCLLQSVSAARSRA